MITRPTTLILGAGASAHLGYPLGTGLRDGLLVQLQQLISTMKGKDEDKAGRLQYFHDRLSRGGWQSPDAFLEKHPEYVDIGKDLMALVLK